MSVVTTNVSNSYTANGSQTIFPFTFQILTDFNALVNPSPTFVNVYFATAGSAQVLQAPSTYTVNGPYASSNPSTVVFNSPPANGTNILIIRSLPPTQLFRFLDGTAFPASSFEMALDKLTMVFQQAANIMSLLGFQGVLMNNSSPVTSGVAVGSWYLVPLPAAGGIWGYVCTATGSPDTWKSFAPISF